MSLLKYSFSLTPPAPPPAPAPAKHTYTYSEFTLELAHLWRQMPTAEENTLNFVSDADGAAIIISVDFYDIPAEKAQMTAEYAVDRRLDAVRQLTEGPVTVLHRSILPHSSGGGLEMSLAVEPERGHLHLFLGYVTARKVLNFTMICPPGKEKAVALFNATVPGFRPRLP